MGQLLNPLQGSTFIIKAFAQDPPKLYRKNLSPHFSKYDRYRAVLMSTLARRWGVVYCKNFVNLEDHAPGWWNLEALPHVQTLGEFPREELPGKVVMVRFDSTLLLLEEMDLRINSVKNAVFTIKYLHKSAAKVILASNWNTNSTPRHPDIKSVADYLSSVLQLKVLPVKCSSFSMMSTEECFEKADILILKNLSVFKEEVANCSKFSKMLSLGVDIFVNDSFSQSHRILASTVGISRFCSTCLAGFNFQEGLGLLRKAAETKRQPYVAIIGGGNLLDKSAALHLLASTCSALVFVGLMSIQIMQALGLSVSSRLVNHGVCKEAADIIQFSLDKNVQIVYPKDFWCKNVDASKKMELFASNDIPDGWLPVDLGPTSLDEINALLMNSKIIWIGPVKFSDSSQSTCGTSKLARKLYDLTQRGCDVTVVGTTACKAMMQESSTLSAYNVFENASVVWDFFKGKPLPGVLALDRAYPYKIDWDAVFCDTALPLVVDIGSGNGMFLLEMATRRKDLNFLGLEINEKLVKRCLHSVYQLEMKNGHFIATNATSTFRSIVSSYPGELVLVSIQCPNPDFNKPEHRWRMLQRSLVEAVADLLASNGKVFLQSDVEVVALRMKEAFLLYGKGKLAILQEQVGEEWLSENPFGVRSDWERHVLDRGDPMFRLMLSKSTTTNSFN
ncbi:phosphoglycerate kinase, cytosolic-like isoform X2 [Benincasa hispida]|uniref:phosphoglycerate kinase, cytosolic-like isoform X2 n=1 Tax=Benincasa hispida TaxID=102211 RepID=UPI0018FFEAC4|nr:phosphoglycerate kinase, cytosolic-like isoform X2 [Benincasa hispida]